MLVLDVAAFRDKKTVRFVTTRDCTVKADEFPMFYVAEMDREAEKALNVLFASRFLSAKLITREPQYI